MLGEDKGTRRLPIVIGGFEAQAIAVAMERMTPNRPLTHDLFKNAMETFNVELKEVIINNLLDGIFYSRLICLRDGEMVEIDSRTSDALAMAVRFECPIYTYEFILDAAGVILENPMDENDDLAAADERSTASTKGGGNARNKSSLAGYSYDQLNTLLEEVLAEEDYERAAEIRDELTKRSTED